MKEQQAIDILRNKLISKSEKAKKLGFKRSTVYVDGVRKTGYYCGEELHLSLKSLIEHRNKYPLGFDYYYWSNLLKEI